MAVEREDNVAVMSASGAIAVVVGARRLEIPEGVSLAAALLSALAGEAAQLPPALLADLAQELVRVRIGDRNLWRALANATIAAEDIDAAALVALLDAFRRSIGVGPRIDAVFVDLARRAGEGAPELGSKQLVGALGSLSRLGNHVPAADQRKAIQLLLDQWLSCQEEGFSGTPAKEIISLSVSLTNVSETLGVRTSAFLNKMAAWGNKVATASNTVLGVGELIVLLWTLKELTPLGLGPYKDFVALGLARIQEQWHSESYGLLRLVQASEVVLAARHALGDVDNTLVGLVADTMAGAILGACSLDMLVRIVALWDQAGEPFWAAAPALADAVLSKAVDHLRDESLSVAALHSMIDTLGASTFSRTKAFADGKSMLRDAAAQRRDVAESGLVAAADNLTSVASSGTAVATSAQANSSAMRTNASLNTAPRPPSDSWTAPAGDVAAQRDTLPAREPIPLTPSSLAERLGTLCQRGASDVSEIKAVAEALLISLDTLAASEVLPALEQVLSCPRRRLTQLPLLLDIAERLGDLVVAHANDLPTLQLMAALNRFASVGLPYHLLFETVLMEVIERQHTQGVSWSQVIGVLEAFAAVRLRIPELAALYAHLRRPEEIARLPTMALVRFFSAAARLDLISESRWDVSEIVDRILAETTPFRPLPLENSVVLVQGLLLSGTVLLDRQLRHLLAWVSGTRTQQLTPQQLAILRQYSFFVLAQPNAQDRSSLLRLPIEVQRFISGLLCHRASAWKPGISDTTKAFRQEVADSLRNCATEQLGGAPAFVGDAVCLGPAGVADLRVGEQCWLLDGPESYFRPFAAVARLRHTPQERRRAWLLQRLLADPDARGCVADFFPAAASWPTLSTLRRLSWLEWGQARPSERLALFGIGK